MQLEGMTFGRGNGKGDCYFSQTWLGEVFGTVRCFEEEEAGGGDEPAEHQKLEGVRKEPRDRRVDEGGDQEREEADHA